MKIRTGQAPNLPWWRLATMSDEDIKKFNDGFMREEEVEMERYRKIPATGVNMTQDKEGGYCSKCDTVWAYPGKCQCDYQNTKEGIHSRAKELNMKPWTLGCSCEDCNNIFNKMLDQSPSESRQANVYATQIWNEAIEAAVKLCEHDGYVAQEIRKLKK